MKVNKVRAERVNHRQMMEFSIHCKYFIRIYDFNSLRLLDANHARIYASVMHC